MQNDNVNIKSIASLIVSIFSICCCCFWYMSIILGVVALILGVLALNDKNQAQEDSAIAGIVVGAVGIALGVFVGIMYVVMLNNYSQAEVAMLANSLGIM